MKLSDDTLEKLCILRRRHVRNKTPLRIYIDEEQDFLQGHLLGSDGFRLRPDYIRVLLIVVVVAFAIYITYSFII